MTGIDTPTRLAQDLATMGLTCHIDGQGHLRVLIPGYLAREQSLIITATTEVSWTITRDQHGEVSPLTTASGDVAALAHTARYWVNRIRPAR